VSVNAVPQSGSLGQLHDLLLVNHFTKH